MLAFEFPDGDKARAFADAVTIHLRSTASVTHRVVDVVEPTDDDPHVSLAARDFLIMLARKFGAVDGPRPYDLTRAERELLRELLIEISTATPSPGDPYMLPLDAADVVALRKLLGRAVTA